MSIPIKTTCPLIYSNGCSRREVPNTNKPFVIHGNSICIVANTRVNDGIINNIVTKKNTFISTSKNKGYEIALTIFCWYFRSRS